MSAVNFFFNGACGSTKDGEQLYAFRLRNKESKSYKFRASQLGSYIPASRDGVAMDVSGAVKVSPGVGDRKGWVDCTNAKVIVLEVKPNAYVPPTVEADFASTLGDDPAGITDAE